MAPPICKYFLQGMCRFGSNCRFQHPSDQNSGAFGAGVPKNVNHVDQLPPSNDVINAICLEMSQWEACKLWPISCFGYSKYSQSLPGMVDISPEEVREKAYECYKNNNPAPYLDWLKKNTNEAKERIKELSNPSAATRQILMQYYNTLNSVSNSPAAPTSSFGNQLTSSTNQSKPGNQGAFGSSPLVKTGSAFGGTGGGGSVFGGGGGTGGGSVFGGTGTGGGSAFGGAGTAGSSAFGGAGTAGSSAFGGASTGSAFGAGTGGGLVFGGTGTGGTSAFGGTGTGGSTFGGGTGGSVFGNTGTGGSSAFGGSGTGGAGAFGAPSQAIGQSSSPMAQVPANSSQSSVFGSQPSQSSGGSVFANNNSTFNQNQGAGTSVFTAPANNNPTPQGALGANSSVFAGAAASSSGANNSPLKPQPTQATNSVFSTSQSTFSAFGASAAPSPLAANNTTANMAAAADVYTPMDKLSKEELAAYQDAKFIPWKVPTNAPPKELC